MAELATQQRLVSLDVFRGITIAGMVLVNNPGTWASIYGPLKHAEWHGITPTDYIFPFFLFIVGVAIPIAFAKRLRDGVDRGVYVKILTRSLSIFGVGIAMSAIPFFVYSETAIPAFLKILLVLSYSAALFFYLRGRVALGLTIALVSGLIVTAFWLLGTQVEPYNPETMRIMGVLQRIAVCYLIVSLIYLHTNWKQQLIIGIALLLIYWILLVAVPVPGCEVTTIDDKACNLAAWIDRVVLTEPHIWRSSKVYDPEGLLSTIGAVVTTISGVLTGTWLMGSRPATGVRSEASVDQAPAAVRTPLQTVAGMFFAGTVVMAIGWCWALVLPLNKSLWTSSYVLYNTGLALLTLGACYYLIDILGYKRWAKPFVVFGVNALALFAFSGILARLMGMIKVAGPEGKDVTLQQWIFGNIFLPFLSPVNASLAYAVCYIVFWLFLMWLLYRRRIFIKV